MKQKLHAIITELIESGELKAEAIAIKTRNQDRQVVLTGWKILEQPTPEVADLLIEAAEYFVLIDGWSGTSLTVQ
jgi:hypothetical protein